MRILFLSDNFPPEGNAPASRLWEHATRWVRDGHEVTVITCAPNFPEGRLFEGYTNSWRQIEVLEGIRVVRVKTYITRNEQFVKRTLDYMSFMFMGFIMGLFERRPDVVVATSPQFFCAIGGWALSVAKGRPFVFELRDLWPASIIAVGAMRESKLLWALEKVELFLYRRARLIIAVTQSCRKDLIERGVSSEKISVVYNGVDLNQYFPKPRDPKLEAEFGLQNKFVAGYMGTHGLAHALPKVIEAAKLLKDEAHIVFSFMGAGAERARVEALVKEYGLTNVRLIPRQSKARMSEFWSLCDVALVPLRSSPVFATAIPSKIFESMGMGVPILLSLPVGEATDIIQSADVGLCVPPENPGAMAQALAYLSTDRKSMERYRKNAFAAAQQYSREVMARKMVNLLEQACDASALVR